MGYLALRTVRFSGKVVKSGEEFWEVEMLNTYLWMSITWPFCSYRAILPSSWGLFFIRRHFILSFFSIKALFRYQKMFDAQSIVSVPKACHLISRS